MERVRTSVSEPPFIIAGGIRAHHASVIADAFATVSHTSLRLTDEVEIMGEGFQVAAYPSGPGEFLVGGNLQTTHDEARRIARHLGDALAAAGLVYELELSPEQGGPDERFAHPDFGRITADARRRENLDASNLDIGERLQSGTADEVRRGTLRDQPVLLTFAGAHPESHESLRGRLALVFDGIAPLLYCGPSGDDQPYSDLLVEQLPPGRSLFEAAPLDERRIGAIGAAVASVAGTAHAAGARIDGLRPELIFVDDAGQLTGIAPRGPVFIASAPITRGLRSYRIPFMAPELLVSRTASHHSDVFSLCATLWYAATKTHPFGDTQDISGIVARMATGALMTWPGSTALGRAVTRGLATDPLARPSMPELGRMLEALPSSA